MTALVIDASVAIKWVIDEPGTAHALALRRHRLSAPDLLVAECAIILWKKVRRGELSDQEAKQQRPRFFMAVPTSLLEPMSALMEQAVQPGAKAWASGV